MKWQHAQIKSFIDSPGKCIKRVILDWWHKKSVSQIIQKRIDYKIRQHPHRWGNRLSSRWSRWCTDIEGDNYSSAGVGDIAGSRNRRRITKRKKTRFCVEDRIICKTIYEISNYSSKDVGCIAKNYPTMVDIPRFWPVITGDCNPNDWHDVI